MARITSNKLTVEGFKEASSWIGKLLSPLNQFIGEVIFAFNGNITIPNLKQEFKDIQIVNNSTNFPIRFQTRFNQFPKAIYLAYIFNETTSSMDITNQPWFNWSFSNGVVSVTNMTNLTSNHKYFIRFHVIYE